MHTDGCSVDMPIIRGVEQDSIQYMMKVIHTHIPKLRISIDNGNAHRTNISKHAQSLPTNRHAHRAKEHTRHAQTFEHVHRTS